MNRVRELRINKGIKQFELAQKLGISREWLHAIENGKNPSINDGKKIARIFRMSMEDIFF